MQFDEHLRSLQIDDSLFGVIQSCLQGIYEIEHIARTGEALGVTSDHNVFGELQTKLDVVADEVFIRLCKQSALVERIASEELESEQVLHPDGQYAVCFDPLDGSSLIDVNFAVGTIIGIYPKGTFIGKKPSEMHAAVVAVYGPRTTVFIAIRGKGTHVYLLTPSGLMLQTPDLKVAEDGSYFAPGNLRVCLSSPPYRALLDYWLKEKYTLRYSGGMVPDVTHIIVKGKGIFIYPGNGEHPDGKLRMLYECGTMGMLMVEAGGSASDGAVAILDKPIASLEQRSPIFLGSVKEVERAIGFWRVV